jgi:radical SAM protein with 4Fe4S-binding SPASM domain
VQGFISVDYNGDIYPCERLEFNNPFINISEQPLEDILTNRSFMDHVSNVMNISEDCPNCEVRNICNGGCRHERNDGKFIYCSSMKNIINHIEPIVSGLKDKLFQNTV